MTDPQITPPSYDDGFRAGESYGKEQAEIGASYAGYQAGVAAERARCAALCREEGEYYWRNKEIDKSDACNMLADAIEAEPAAPDAGVTCDECGGKGWLTYPQCKLPCQACHGTGKISLPRTVLVDEGNLPKQRDCAPKSEPPRACLRCGEQHAGSVACVDVLDELAPCSQQSGRRLRAAVAERQRRIIERAADMCYRAFAAGLNCNDAKKLINAMLDEPRPLGDTMTDDAVGTITYRLPGGRVRNWSVGCHATKDNAETLRAHLARTMPDAVFIGAVVVKKQSEPSP